MRSKIIYDNCNPEFDELFAFAVAPGATLNHSQLHLTIWDYDEMADDECMGRLRLDLANIATSPEVCARFHTFSCIQIRAVQLRGSACIQEGDIWYYVYPPPRQQQVVCSFYFGSPAKKKNTKPTTSSSNHALWKVDTNPSFFCPLNTYEGMFNFTLKSKQGNKMLASGSLKLMWDENTNGVVYSFSGSDGVPVSRTL